MGFKIRTKLPQKYTGAGNQNREDITAKHCLWAKNKLFKTHKKPISTGRAEQQLIEHQLRT
jgi:hypothetical protein